LIEVIGLLGVAALLAFTVRKRLALVATVTLAALAAAIAVVVVMPGDASGQVLDLTWRMSELARLAAVLLLGTLALLVLAVWLDEPAYNFFPTALVIAAVVVAVLVLTTPIAIYAALLLGLLVPVGSFTFQVHRNRSAEAAFRHFSFVALGGCLGISALALSASLGRDQPPATFVLLVVILVLAFALNSVAGLKQASLTGTGNVVATKTFDGSPREASVEFPLSADRDGWYAIEVEDTAGRKAYSNPIWIDVVGLPPLTQPR